jgi:hypothetical protein
MEERTPGDRTSLCELVRYVSVLGDEALLRSVWAGGEYYSSFDSLLAIIFDDFGILRRANMVPGYLGTPERLPQELREFAIRLDEFARAHPFADRRSDLELLDLPEWKHISAAARVIANVTRAWRNESCAP